ncbi:GntR family transcriptional regulator [Companilactobacillus tucceti DSM 20183]|uniref:GntR family transcriptional regulator n=2 Tax=Companilactobacillus tucceti TaxID=238012 RepID=A0A0R1IXG1_9LACO|nr:GntR family transcriptional regulator [Companilactobacillus tucceti DSM 20183]
MDVNNMQDKAYREINHRILRSTYAPGDKISESLLEQDLNLGRTPVREALIRLRRDGLINIVPQSGTYVSKINLSEATNARFVRESVERKVMVEAAAVASESDISYLNDILDKQLAASKNSDHEMFFELDEKFHQYFYKMTNKMIVWNWLQVTNDQLLRFRWLRLKVVQLNWDNLIKEHQKICQAVGKHDPEEAERLSINHLHLMIDEESDVLEIFPNYFI